MLTIALRTLCTVSKLNYTSNKKMQILDSKALDPGGDYLVLPSNCLILEEAKQLAR